MADVLTLPIPGRATDALIDAALADTVTVLTGLREGIEGLTDDPANEDRADQVVARVAELQAMLALVSQLGARRGAWPDGRVIEVEWRVIDSVVKLALIDTAEDLGYEGLSRLPDPADIRARADVIEALLALRALLGSDPEPA